MLAFTQLRYITLGTNEVNRQQGTAPGVVILWLVVGASAIVVVLWIFGIRVPRPALAAPGTAVERPAVPAPVAPPSVGTFPAPIEVDSEIPI